MKHQVRSLKCPATRQQGLVLFIALIVLVAMTMAGIALIRSTDTGNVIAGNFAFRQAAMQETDTGMDIAFRAISDPLDTNYIANKAVDAGPRYYALMQTASTTPALTSKGAPSYIEDMSFDDAVSTADVYAAGVGPNGNRVRYVIERMCNPLATGGAPATEAEIRANCLLHTPSSASTSSRNALRIKLGSVRMLDVYYRITVRVDGPRNTVSIVQAIVRT